MAAHRTLAGGAIAFGRGCEVRRDRIVIVVELGDAVLIAIVFAIVKDSH